MKEKPENILEYQEANELFESLQLSDWKINEGYKKKGGQATILAVNHKNGDKGVFRFLKNRDETSKKRFYHELGILIDPKFKHKNIVNILEHTNNDEYQWYISERGRNFTTFWQNQRKRFSENPERLVESAIEILKRICEGLKILHENGVVHRDIKPDNIIVVKKDSEKYPVLIDFGISFSDFGEERITKIDDAVGNIRYSPDVMMNRLDEVLPWLDIFQLAQVLIWMLQISPVKNWSRPLDWRWVNYDERLSKSTILSLRAATAQCSEQSISPQNASEFLNLLEKLFPNKLAMEKEKYSINIESVNSGIAQGIAGKSIKLAENHKSIEASYVIAKRFFEELHNELKRLALTIQEHKLDFGITEMCFEEFYEEILNSSKIREDLYTLRFPSGNTEPSFTILISCNVYLPSLINNSYRPDILNVRSNYPDISNIFVFDVIRRGTKNAEVLLMRKLTLERDGKISLREYDMKFIKNVEIHEIIQMIKECIEDPKPWETLQSDY